MDDAMTNPVDRSESVKHHVAVLMYHDTDSGSFEASARAFAELWENLVPECGQAASIQGEIIRTVGMLATEDRRNGCVNWGEDFEAYVEFLRAWLPSKQVFSAEQCGRIMRDLDAVLVNGRDGVDYQVIRVVFGRLIEDAASYCQACSQLLPIKQEFLDRA
jgi:hypothetical protein